MRAGAAKIVYDNLVGQDTPEPKRPQCVKCAYYMVTWDPARPHGCRAMGFKSKEIPSQLVFKNSGAECRCFKPKRPKQ